jgi:hypothetical protein
VITGKSILAFKRDQEGKQELSGRCFAWVQTYDEKPKRRLFELLKRQGMQPNQQVDFLSDGGEDVHNVQLYLNPQAEHLLDWFHLTMRLTVLSQTAKELPERLGEEEDKYELRTGVLKDLERIKWYLWHGNVFQALNELQSLEIALDAAAFESKNEHSQKLLKGSVATMESKTAGCDSRMNDVSIPNIPTIKWWSRPTFASTALQHAAALKKAGIEAYLVKPFPDASQLEPATSTGSKTLGVRRPHLICWIRASSDKRDFRSEWRDLSYMDPSSKERL